MIWSKTILGASHLSRMWASSIHAVCSLLNRAVPWVCLWRSYSSCCMFSKRRWWCEFSLSVEDDVILALMLSMLWLPLVPSRLELEAEILSDSSFENDCNSTQSRRATATSCSTTLLIICILQVRIIRINNDTWRVLTALFPSKCVLIPLGNICNR